MAIAIDNFDDYVAVIVGRVAKMRDCTPQDLDGDKHIHATIERCWNAGIPYLTAVSLIEG